MADYTNSSNMNLPIPTVGVDPGPDYADNVNTALTLIDSHDHTPGYGVQITPAGFNINAALNFNNQPATNVAYVTLSAQLSTPDIGTVYESGVDLFFVDGLGNNIRITQDGAVAGTPGSISNLLPPASASYNSGSQTFVWESDTGIAANMDFGAAIMRNLSPNSTFALTLQPPALSNNFTITLPTLPASSKILTIDSAGTMSAVTDVDNVTLQITSNNLGIKNNGVGNAQLADNAVTTSKIVDGSVTDAKLASDIILNNYVIISSSQSYVVPDTANFIIVSGVGGGGGGQGGGRQSTGGTGGSGGGGSIPVITGLPVTPGETLTITIGAGGTGGASGASGAAGVSGTAGGTTTITRDTTSEVIFRAEGGAAGIASPTASSWSPTVQLVAAGAGGPNSTNGSVGEDNYFATGGRVGLTGSTRGGGGGGGAGYGNGGDGGSFTTYTFTIPSSSVSAGTSYSHNGHTYIVKFSTTSSTSLKCSGTGAPLSSGTLTFVSGPTPGNIAFSAVSTGTAVADKTGMQGNPGAGGGGGAAGSVNSGDGGGVGGAGGDGQIIVYLIEKP